MHLQHSFRTIWELIRDTFTRWISDDAFQMSAAIAFYSAFSMAPGLLILVSLVNLVYGSDAAGGIETQLGDYVGQDAANLITSMIIRTSDQFGPGRTQIFLAFTVMLIGASAVFAQLLVAMNRAWRVQPKSHRGIWGVFRDRFWPFTLVVIVSTLLGVSFLISTAIQAYSAYVNRFLPGVSFVWHYVDLGFSFVIVTALFALVFKFLPDARVAWSDVWIGAVVTAVFFSAGKFAFSLYLGTTAIESVYGPAGSLLVILIWVFVSTAILLLGAEFTHIYAERHGHSVIPKSNAVRID